MDDLLSEFLTETAENISVLDVELVRLEQEPNSPGLLGNIFRLVHTIKGTCGFLGLPRLEAVAHAAENVLGRFRDGELHVSPAAVSLILQALDRIKAILAVLEATESEPAGDDALLISNLNHLAETGIAFVGEMDDLIPEAALAAEEEAAVVAAPAEPAAAATAPAVDKPVATEPQAMKETGAAESSVANSSIRVNVDVLENLMTMVSELVLTRNQLLQIMRTQTDSEFAAPLQHLNHVVSELQDGVMKTRMQPIGNAWSKLPRIVRDLAHELGKKIDLDMRGADTELDRQVLELIKDPLTHMVRNSADHGVEVPAQRLRAGKPETGRIVLDAYHEGGHIIIQIADDGKGLAVGKIKQKALDNGLASEAELAGMSEQQIQQFIFKAGFSTAEKVTSVSGRGVGMDVVRTNIEKIGGTIELRSTEGKGSTFIIKIPLTLAIVSALVVEAGGERFAMPQISVVELVRATADGEHRIERIKGAPVLRLRNRLLPLVSLRKLLRIDTVDAADCESFIIVTQVGTYSFGIMVDRVFDTEEIVVKPVSPILRHIPMFSGNTILGDGSVIMILDPNGIASATGSVAGERAAAHSAAAQGARHGDATSLMVFRAGAGAPKAVPLSLVARLEDVDRRSIELSDGQPVVQYRGRLMPLVPFEPGFQMQSEGKQPVLVFSDENDRSMGLMVDEIVDIVEDHVRIQIGGERPGLIGSAIIAGKATDVIDVGYYIAQAFGDFFGSTEAFEEEAAAKRVLLVDDSPFFRNLLTPLLTVAGYQVRAMENAAEALEACEAGEKFDVIVSDIEMPGMSGFEFAARVKADERWSNTPVVALSSHATPRDVDRGRQAGFSDHVAKFDRDALLRSLAETLSHTKGAA